MLKNIRTHFVKYEVTYLVWLIVIIFIGHATVITLAKRTQDQEFCALMEKQQALISKSVRNYNEIYEKFSDLKKGFAACIELRDKEAQPIIGSDGKLTAFAKSFVKLDDVCNETVKNYLGENAE